jgi:hypothetical protein
MWQSRGLPDLSLRLQPLWHGEAVDRVVERGVSADQSPGDAVDEPVPKLPRGRGLKFSKPEMFRIGLTLVMLIFVVMLTQPCASAMSNFVMDMDGSASKPSDKMPKPGTVEQPEPQQFEQLRPGMTEAEIKAAIERSRRSQGSGSSSVAP